MGVEKLKSNEEIEQIVNGLAGKTVVTTNGSFDIMHAGHVHFLEEAKRQGDTLIVGLNTDRSIRENKGDKRPIIDQDSRARMLCALEMVDYVVMFDEKTPVRLLEIIKPDVHVNGDEYGEDCVEAETVKKNGGRIHVVRKIPGKSTSEIIEKIKGL